MIRQPLDRTESSESELERMIAGVVLSPDGRSASRIIFELGVTPEWFGVAWARRRIWPSL